MAAFFETFGGDPVQPSRSPYAALTLNANTQLAWPIQFQNTNLNVPNYLLVTPTNNGFTLTMPTALDVFPGMALIINNPSAFTFTLNAFDGSLIYNFPATTARYFILTNNTTAAGIWLSHPFAAGAASVTSVNAVSGNNNLVIGGVPITNAGTITIALANDLASIVSFGAGTGIACHTAANTYALRTVLGTANQIGVVNSDGAAGNITISLAPNITGVNSIIVNNVGIQNNSITTQQANQNLILAPNGIGLVEIQGGGLRINLGLPAKFYAINGANFVQLQAGAQAVDYSLIWPTIAPVNGQVLQYDGANQLGWANVTTFGGPSIINGIPRYTNTNGSLGNSVATLDAIGNMHNVLQIGVSNILLGGAGGNLPNTIATTNVNGNLILSPNGVGTVQTTGAIELLLQQSVAFYDNGVSNNYISFNAPGALTATQNFTWPNGSCDASQVMVSGNLIGGAGGGGGNPSLIYSYLTAQPNLLRNGGFSIWQRGTSFTNATVYPNNNLQYCADGWCLLSNGNNIVNVSRGGPAAVVDYAGSTFSWRFTCSTGGAKFGLVQILESSETMSLRFKNAALTFLATGVGTTNIRYSIIYFTGAPDTCTSNIVTAWGASGTNPTLAANWFYLNPPAANTVLINAFSIYKNSGDPPIPATSNNVGVFIWCDQTNGAGGNTLDLACINLTSGPNWIPFYPEIFEIELQRCKRFFQKDVAYSTAPFTANAHSSVGRWIADSTGAAINIPNGAIFIDVLFEVELTQAANLTIVIYPFTNTALRNVVSDQGGTDLAANTGTLNGNDVRGFRIQNTSGGNATTAGYFLFHFTASAEF